MTKNASDFKGGTHRKGILHFGKISQDREWYGLCFLMFVERMKGKGIRVMKLNTIPPQDYLEPPGHVKTQSDMQLWARIMMESECPCIHLPRCDPHTFHRIADEQDISPYLVYMSDKDEPDSLRSYWLIRES